MNLSHSDVGAKVRPSMMATSARGCGVIMRRFAFAVLAAGTLAGCVSFAPPPFNRSAARMVEPSAGTSIVARIAFASNSVPAAAPFLFKAPDSISLQGDIARFQSMASNLVIRDAVSAAERAMRVAGVMIGSQEDGSRGLRDLTTAAATWQQLSSNTWPVAQPRLALERAAYMRYSMSRTLGRAEYSHGEMRVYGPAGEVIGDAGYESKRGVVSFMYRIDGCEYVFREVRTWVQTVREKDKELELSPTNTIAWANFLDVLFMKMRTGGLQTASVRSQPKNVEFLTIVDGQPLPVQKFDKLAFAVTPQSIVCGAPIGKGGVTIMGYSALDILANLCLMNTIGTGRDLTDKKVFQNFEQDVNLERDRLFFVPEVVFFSQE